MITAKDISSPSLRFGGLDKTCEKIIKYSEENNLYKNLIHPFMSSSDPMIVSRKSGWTFIQNHLFVNTTNRFRKMLLELNVSKGDVVFISSFSCWEWFAVEMACLSIGAIVVGVDPLIDEKTFTKIYCQTKPKVLFVDSKKSKKIWNINKTPMKIICWQNINADAGSYEDLPLLFEHDVVLSDPATIIFTSGTTGDPKGIVYTHGQILEAVKNIQGQFPELTKTKERFISWLPLSHLFQRMMNYIAVLQKCDLYFLEDPREIARVLPQVKPTILIGVPKFFEKIRKEVVNRVRNSQLYKRALFSKGLEIRKKVVKLNLENATFNSSLNYQLKIMDSLVFKKIKHIWGSQVKLFLSGSAPLSEETLEFFHLVGCPIYEAYGVSENATPIAMNTFGGYRPKSVGRPLSGQRVLISKQGEILVKSASVLKKYWVDESLAVDKNGYYHTGDLGYMDEDGYLFIKGRITDYIKLSNGHKVFPQHIESLLNKEMDIEQSIVLGEGKDYLIALIYAANQSHPENDMNERIQSLIDRINKRLNRHEQIIKFYLMKTPFTVHSGELTTTMKLRRQAIKKNYEIVTNQLFNSCN